MSIEVGGLVTGELDGEAALGLVVGTVPATPLGFSVGLAPGQYAQLDDVVSRAVSCRACLACRSRGW